ncbi:hypothetical protein HDU84_002118 [Entophlyctis sp. JEL0112]|nr:hypothetical protein HDU84_002118 [Entophlyctis sp. JEL0112]
MSKSAPDLFATPDRVDGSERRYSRSSSRRDSVKSLCFDNVIKEVCLFSSDDSPARISQSPRYPESADEFSSPESEVEEIRFDNEYSFGQLTEDMDYDNKLKPVTKIYFPWTLISRTPKIPNQSPPIISIDSVRLSPSSTPTLVPAHTSNQPPPPQLLTFSIIVQNLAYVKNVAVRYTTDNWRTHFDVTASFVSSITRTTDSIVGLDRFDATIAVPTIPDKSSRDTWGTDCAPESDEQDFLAIELAARVKMNGIEAWDNNSGRNHGTVVMRIVRSVSGLMSAATAAAMIGSASMGLGGRSIGCGAAFRTIEEVVGAATRAAVKSAQAVAAEAEAIKRDFDLEWRRNSKSTFTNMLEHNSGNRRRSSFPGEKKRELATPKLPPAAIQEPPPPPVNKPMGFTLFDSACSVSESRASYRFPRSRNIQGTEESGPQYQNNDSPFYGWAPVTKYSGSPILGACEDASELFCDDEVADDKSFFGSAPLQQLKPHHQKCDVSQKSPINRSLSAPSTVFGSWRTPSTTTERRAALFSRRAASEFEDDSSEEENTWKSLPPKMVPRSHDVDDIVVKSLEGWNCWDD